MEKAALADVVELTKELIREYQKGNPKPWFDLLSTNSVFVGTGENMLFGAENIKKHLRRYAEYEKGEIFREVYIPIVLNQKTAIVIAQITSGGSKGRPLHITSLDTFVYQLIGRETKLVYEHTSYEYFKEGKLSLEVTPLAMDINTFQFVKELMLDNPRFERLCLSNGKQTLFLDLNTIIYIKGEGHGTEFHCMDKVINSPKKIRELMAELPDDFYQIHRSYIINTHYLTSLCCYEAELISGVKIPIPALNYGQVKKDLEEKLNRPLRKRKKAYEAPRSRKPHA